MSEPANDRTAAAIDSATVRLTFELGDFAMPVGELSQLDAGFLFPFRTSLTRSVIVKANGAPFGVGELVQIDGALAVRLLEGDGDG